MLVRLIALLLALGMLVISTQARDLAPTSTPSALVDDANELPPVALVEVASIPIERTVVRVSLPAIAQPVRYLPELFVFRPPRAVAFA